MIRDLKSLGMRPELVNFYRYGYKFPGHISILFIYMYICVFVRWPISRLLKNPNMKIGLHYQVASSSRISILDYNML